jgi:hypothetical protein
MVSFFILTIFIIKHNTMGLLDKLTQVGSDFTAYDGNQPDQMAFLDQNSPVHNVYSINGTPPIIGYPAPSSLDLDGQTPDQYLNNLPE